MDTYYNYTSTLASSAISMEIGSLPLWEGIKQRSKSYFTKPEYKGKRVKTYDGKFHLIKIQKIGKIELYIRTLLMVITLATAIIPLIAGLVTTFASYKNTHTYFYKREALGSCVSELARNPKKLSSLKALHAFDPSALDYYNKESGLRVIDFAIYSNNTEVIKWLHSLDSEIISKKSIQGSSKSSLPLAPFIRACINGSSRACKLLTELNPSLLSETDCHGEFTGFYYLCCRNKQEDISYFCDKYPLEIKSQIEANPNHFFKNKLISTETRDYLKDKFGISRFYEDIEFADHLAWKKSFSFHGMLKNILNKFDFKGLNDLINPEKIQFKTQQEHNRAYKAFCIKYHPDKRPDQTQEDKKKWQQVQDLWAKYKETSDYKDLPKS